MLPIMTGVESKLNFGDNAVKKAVLKGMQCPTIIVEGDKLPGAITFHTHTWTMITSAAVKLPPVPGIF